MGSFVSRVHWEGTLMRDLVLVYRGWGIDGIFLE